MTNPAAASPPDTFPSADGELLLLGPAGRIEAHATVPEPADARPAVALICHPHPLHGGTMHNKVVTILERSLRELGAKTLKFNFRGVGQSTGVFDDGRGETLDCMACAQWLRQVAPEHDLWLAGFSFGSYVALRAARELRPDLLLSIAPPVDRYDFSLLARPACPWIIVQGQDDEVVPSERVDAWAATLDPAPQYLSMPDTSHFFHRKLMDLRGVVKSAIKRELN